MVNLSSVLVPKDAMIVGGIFVLLYFLLSAYIILKAVFSYFIYVDRKVSRAYLRKENKISKMGSSRFKGSRG
jgi:hypothetical protein